MDPTAASTSFDSEQRFVIENFNWAEPFSGFFPGIAGKWGIPLWTYYVSRGQAVCSLGSKDKDGAILEFLSFNRACQVVALQGFRTFLRLNHGPVYEPFRKVRDGSVQQKLILQSHELILEERNASLDLTIQVVYFPLVLAPVGGLVRCLSITNHGEQTTDVQLLDGVPRLLPYGVTFENVKVISRHIEAMMGVAELEGLPLFRLKQTAEDRPQIGRLRAANFFAGCLQDGTILRGDYLVDPKVIFGTPDDFSHPWAFDFASIEELLSKEQVRENRTPCAFIAQGKKIPPGQTFSLYSTIGFTPNEDRLRRFIAQMGTPSFLAQKRSENKEVIEEIKNRAFSVSSRPLFDQYCQETFLENALRGGMPIFFRKEKGCPFYTYSRKNGDLERDYHWFVLEPTYLSQGNSHYRDICQNRRMETWFFPQVKEHNIKLFMNLIQLDGYNPLVIQGQQYIGVEAECIKDYLRSIILPPQPMDDLAQFATQPFTPGEFILQLEDQQIEIQTPYEALLDGLLNLCRRLEIGDTHAGFWIDHWIYTIDLIDNYLMIYPDQLKAVLWDDRDTTFYDNPDVVMPRKEKYVLRDGQVRQYNAVRRDPEKQSLIASRTSEKNKVRTLHGQGEVYRANLFVKLLCILANKIAVLDPMGLGVEMEADKPGWNDSLNGLPGLLGSSLCETLELLRAFRFMAWGLSQMALKKSDVLPVFKELASFMRGLKEILGERSAEDGLARWEGSHRLLESFRAETRLGVDGEEEPITVAELSGFLDQGLKALEAIFSEDHTDRFLDPAGIPYTYFIHEATACESIATAGPMATDPQKPNLQMKTFTQRPLCLFLEGPVHYLKLFPEQASRIYHAIRASGLYDRKLKMFKVCESLREQPYEIGRISAYAAGWIENESIYTHMEYKWLLELLRSGLADQFYEEIIHLLPPFLDPEVYGRSTMENCSFIVSSAFPDRDLHGRAFQPRLSGVTAEMLEIWSLMVAGPRPFRLDSQGRLQLLLEPLLPDWLFTEREGVYRYWDHEAGWEEVHVPANSFAFRFLGQTLVIYHNRERKSTFGPKPAVVLGCTFTYRNGRELKEDGPFFSDLQAKAVRAGEVRKMDVILV